MRQLTLWAGFFFLSFFFLSFFSSICLQCTVVNCELCEGGEKSSPLEKQFAFNFLVGEATRQEKNKLDHSGTMCISCRCVLCECECVLVCEDGFRYGCGMARTVICLPFSCLLLLLLTDALLHQCTQRERERSKCFTKLSLQLPCRYKLTLLLPINASFCLPRLLSIVRCFYFASPFNRHWRSISFTFPLYLSALYPLRFTSLCVCVYVFPGKSATYDEVTCFLSLSLSRWESFLR